MTKISIFSTLSTLHMFLYTALNGTRVGVDQMGNTYYRCKPRKGALRERRWVMYADGVEASQVPPEWHGWLHHQTDDIPAGDNKYRRPWQKPHQPNKTGTVDAYLPPGASRPQIVSGAPAPTVLKAGCRAPATGDYAAWQPPR